MATGERGLRVALRDSLRAPVPQAMRTELGILWIVSALFAIQVVTGILLSLYYQSSPAAVGESIAFLMRDVSWGWLIRGLHHWAGQAMILAVAVRVVHLFWTAGYARGRAWAWYAGVLLFWSSTVATLSGDLLPWDETAYWRVTRLIAGLEAIPLVGSFLAEVVRGGTEVTATTLARTYSAHALFLPWVLWLLLLGDLWFAARRAALITGGER